MYIISVIFVNIFDNVQLVIITADHLLKYVFLQVIYFKLCE